MGALAVALLILLAAIFLLALNVLFPVRFQFDASLVPDCVRYRAKLKLPLIPWFFAVPDPFAKRRKSVPDEQKEKPSTQEESGDEGLLSRLPEVKSAFETIRSQYPRFAGLVSYVTRAVSFDKFHISARIGTGDAYETALLAGSLRAVVGVAVGLARRAGIRFTTRPLVRILPVYDRAAVSAEVSVVTSIVPLRGIVAAVRLYQEFRRIKRVSQSVVSKPAAWNTKA